MIYVYIYIYVNLNQLRQDPTAMDDEEDEEQDGCAQERRACGPVLAVVSEERV